MSFRDDNLVSALARELVKTATAAARHALEDGDLKAYEENYERADRGVERLGELLELEAKVGRR